MKRKASDELSDTRKKNKRLKQTNGVVFMIDDLYNIDIHDFVVEPSVNNGNTDETVEPNDEEFTGYKSIKCGNDSNTIAVIIPNCMIFLDPNRSELNNKDSLRLNLYMTDVLGDTLMAFFNNVVDKLNRDIGGGIQPVVEQSWLKHIYTFVVYCPKNSKIRYINDGIRDIIVAKDLENHLGIKGDIKLSITSILFRENGKRFISPMIQEIVTKETCIPQSDTSIMMNLRHN